MKLVSLVSDNQSGNEIEMNMPVVCFWADGDQICCFGTKIMQPNHQHSHMGENSPMLPF